MLSEEAALSAAADAVVDPKFETIVIRAIEQRDDEQVTALWHHGLLAPENAFPLLGFLSDIVWLVVYLVCAFLWDMRKPHAYYSQPGHAMLVAETNGEVVGVAGLLPGVHRKAAKLSRISVAQRVRGRGIGKRLVTEMIDLSRQMGSETLMATTRNLRMQRLLGDLGFRRRNRGFEKDLTMSL